MSSPTSDPATRETGARSVSEELSFAGIQTFLRRPYQRDLEGVDVAVLGVPLDTATLGRPGTRFGPRGVRAASSLLLWDNPLFGWDFHPTDRLSIVDYGDVHFNVSRPAAVPESIEACARGILGAGVRVLGIGGDHFVSYPLLRAHHAVHGPLALIHFDAHTDTWPDRFEDGICHGTMFWRAARDGIVDPAASVQIGIRTTNADTMGFRVLDAPRVHRAGVEAILEEVRGIVGNRRAYLTFDIDCLDPAYAPGTGTPVVGGLTTNQALEIVRGLAGLDIVGADVVEVSPPYDVGEITALAGATLAASFLCLFALAPQRPRAGAY